MKIKPIRTEHDYQAALQKIDHLFNAEVGTSEADLLEVLIILVKAYEAHQYPIPLPDPVSAIEFHMDRLGLTRRDLEPFIGGRSRVSEILNRKRPLTSRMMRNLHDHLGISFDILMQPNVIEETQLDQAGRLS
jgi:HTH-type transcriptional regulator/antitoxin HigA